MPQIGLFDGPKRVYTGAMRLSDWLAATGTSLPDFAVRVGHSEAGVKKWLRGERFPRPDAITKIEQITDGQVTYRDLLPREAAA